MFLEVIQKLSITAPGFLLGIVFHEFGHAWMAQKYGDNTAKLQGRLSLNPIVHMDLVGTVIFPLIGIMLGSIPFGWAKPVPIDPRNFKDIRKGIFWVNFAGPLANILIALLSGLLFAIIYNLVPNSFGLKSVFSEIASYSVLINIVLAVFNLIPFPPLDGSKMVSTFMSYEMARKFEGLERYSFVFILFLWMTPIFSYIVSPAVLLGYSLMNFFVNILK